MNIAILTTFSTEILDMMSLTSPNKQEYCSKHNYSFIAVNTDNEPKNLNSYFSHATGSFYYRILEVLDEYDLIWTLDADAIITNMNPRIESLECLGPHVTVCEEGIVSWSTINCGSMVWKNTMETKMLLKYIGDSFDEWKDLVCISQSWLDSKRQELKNILTVAPLKSFNSCAWEKGSHWTYGDLVYHPCGINPYHSKRRYKIRRMLKNYVIH